LKNIIEDNSIKKSLSDTIISGNDYYSVSFSIYKKKLEPLGGYFPVSVNMTFLYKIIIDKETKLPFIVYQENYNPEGVMDQSIKVSLTNYEINKIIPDTNFYFSKYTSEYNRYINPKKKPLISVGDSVLNSNLISFYRFCSGGKCPTFNETLKDKTIANYLRNEAKLNLNKNDSVVIYQLKTQDKVSMSVKPWWEDYISSFGLSKDRIKISSQL
jgi:hypothetical protein